MKHHDETEIKLEVRNSRDVKRRLRALEFESVRARHFECNYLLDFPDQRLRKARCLLRLRFADGRWIVTFKGAPVGSRDYKIRREIETEVEDGNRLREILESLGLREAFRYEKYRTLYVPRNGRGSSKRRLVVYDETPIGNYLELEGPERWIDQVARQLGYRRDEYITASYGLLYRQKCRQRGQEPGNMVFPQHK